MGHEVRIWHRHRMGNGHRIGIRDRRGHGYTIGHRDRRVYKGIGFTRLERVQRYGEDIVIVEYIEIGKSTGI